MKTTGKVTVVVPVYNMAQTVGETLDSILGSRYDDLEVVCVDDGSTDGTAEVLKAYAERHPNVRLVVQENRGVSAARNAGIRIAEGEYILPVDGDNRIGETYIAHAAEILRTRPEVKVVAAEAEFFGERTGRWKLPEFDIRLLARKNIMDVCALYRKADWEACGGYCEDLRIREDWDFWISLLKTGGEVVRLDEVGLYYRVRQGSKRVRDRAGKRELIDKLNARHRDFFEAQLGGRLHYHRSISRIANRWERIATTWKGEIAPDADKETCDYLHDIDYKFRHSGEVIYAGRNTLKRITLGGRNIVAKSFRIPHIINRIAYGLLRKGKAARSYEYALRLRKMGFETPAPVGWAEYKTCDLLGRSYYLSEEAAGWVCYRDLNLSVADEKGAKIIDAIGEFTAKLHENGIIHHDYSGGNILVKEKPDGSIGIALVDLNRMTFGRKVSLGEGCRNFERLTGSDPVIERMGRRYAAVRGLDPEKCVALIGEARAQRLKRKGQL